MDAAWLRRAADRSANASADTSESCNNLIYIYLSLALIVRFLLFFCAACRPTPLPPGQTAAPSPAPTPAPTPVPLTAINTWASIYTGCIVLDTATDFRLWWRTLPNARIELAMYARVSGYMSIGLSTDGSMHSSGAGSDVMLAWVSASGACSFGCVSDQWATARLQPSVDAAPSSLSNVRAGFEGAYMKVSFVRAQASSDAEDRAINATGRNLLIWSVHTTDVPSVGGLMYNKHTTSGALNVNWMAPGCVAPPTVAPTPVPTPA